MRRAICQSAPLAALSASHSLHRLWPIHHTLMLVAEIHYKRYVWVTASAGMRFSSGNCELIKIPFVNIKVAWNFSFSFSFMDVLGDFCGGCSRNRPQTREWQNVGGFLLKQSAFYGNAENIWIFSSSELKIFIFLHLLRLLQEIKNFLPKNNHFTKAGQCFPKEWIAAAFSPAQHILHIKKRERCVKVLIISVWMHRNSEFNKSIGPTLEFQYVPKTSTLRDGQ